MKSKFKSIIPDKIGAKRNIGTFNLGIQPKVAYYKEIISEVSEDLFSSMDNKEVN